MRASLRHGPAAAALVALLALPAGPARAAGADWSAAATAYAAGRASAPQDVDAQTAARCTGRWMLHGDAVDDGAFPQAALDAFLPEMQLDHAAMAVEFFGHEGVEQTAYRAAMNQAEARLTRALAGDAAALASYFEALGQCDLLAEEVRDTAPAPVPPAERAEAAFARLKTLEGTWQLAGQPEHGLRITFRSTARGTVLVEEWTYEGRPHSLTLYHRDGDSLLATHYCPQGNQPRMALAAGTAGTAGEGEGNGEGSAADIRFTFRDMTDFDPASEQYQHDLWFTLPDPATDPAATPDHITRSEIYRDGEGGDHPSALELERVKEG